MKNRVLFLVFFLFGLLLAGNVYAQKPSVRSTETTQIGGKEYYLHHVTAGETLFGLAKAYNVTIEEIETFNPEVKEGLKAGHVLGIPVHPASEPQEEPKVEPKKEEPVEPIEEPVVEPEVETPKVEPKKAEEPKVEPQAEEPKIQPKKVEPKVEEPKAEPVDPPKKGINPDHVVVVGETTYRIVQPNETLYDIAKECGIDVEDLLKNNRGLTEEPAPGTRVAIPKIVNENDYIVHNCMRSERVTSLLKRWKVDESEFRLKNILVGSHVFENQVVLIPIDPITDYYWIDKTPVETVEVEEVEEPEEEPEIEPQTLFLDEDLDATEQCYPDLANAGKRYKVALMVPLYLGEMGKLDVAKENVPKAQKSRSMSFLQFYEGFVMAAKDLEKEGLKLDLKVYDVTDNVSTAERALQAIEGQDFDMIVGPFFNKSFTIIEEYAKSMGIVMVNPLSNRESVIVDSPNVVKVKPGNVGLVMAITNLVKNHYSNANVFIVSREKASDSLFLDQLEQHLNLAVNEEVVVTSNELLQYARHESELREMGSRLVPTLEVEGQVYSTSDLQSGQTEVVLANSVKRVPFSEMGDIKSQLSGVRDNLIIAYGDNNVFATQMLNSLAKTADRYPITLVCIPDWAKFEKLLVDNLLKMNAIYISDFFVDYQSEEVKNFVLRFRDRYSAEPLKYAFEGYDLAYYFLSAMMRYGSDDLLNCLHCHRPELMHTRYRFYYRNYLSPSQNDGKENMYWSVYQYDNEDIELKDINPYEKKEEETK
jgi:LysM repeat protein/ABC-type branched-subunit amino acid transport system substrate-binding protein